MAQQPNKNPWAVINLIIVILLGLGPVWVAANLGLGFAILSIVAIDVIYTPIRRFIKRRYYAAERRREQLKEERERLRTRTELEDKFTKVGLETLEAMQSANEILRSNLNSFPPEINKSFCRIMELLDVIIDEVDRNPDNLRLVSNIYTLYIGEIQQLINKYQAMHKEYTRPEDLESVLGVVKNFEEYLEGRIELLGSQKRLDLSIDAAALNSAFSTSGGKGDE